MLIHENFTGGNIRIEKLEDNIFYLNNELRDTTQNWFYWAFCIEGAAGKTVTFKFPSVRLGYWGPAVSHDLKKWEWLGKGDNADSFTYTFNENENKVYFAHSMLYHPDRFYEFAENNGLEISELCKSKKGRSVPFVTFGDGERIILLTARHHACESTGNYVLEGVLEGLLKSPIENTKVICVPFVDFDGVVDGDQGKSRAPYDHNRDYVPNEPAIYPEVQAIRNIADNGILYGFDFHSPWHFRGHNDTVFVVQKRHNKMNEYLKFSSILENSINELSLQYDKSNDFPPDVDWNSSETPCFGTYMNDIAKAKLAFTLETTYFGTENNIFNQKNSVELGRCFADAIKKYDSSALKISFTGDLMCSKAMLDNEKNNYSVMFDKIRKVLQEADYLVGNCETPVAGEELGYTSERYCFNTPERYLEALKECNFNLLTLANNHTMDRDEEGIIRTLQNCRKYGFDTIGVYDSEEARNNIFIKELNGIKVAFINYTYGTNAFAHHRFLKHKYMVNLYQPEETLEGSIHLLNSNEKIEEDVKKLYYTKNEIFDNIVVPYLEQLKNDIKKAKEMADFVIMVSHCGGQYNAEVDAYTKYICSFIKECGADVIVGHHPHIVQKSDIDKGYLTAYSLGNFICDFSNNNSAHFLNSQIIPYYSILLNLYLTKKDDAVEMKAGFKVLKVVSDENGVQQTFDAYELYKETKDNSLKEEILYFANRFANTNCYSKIEKEYTIQL